MRSLCKPRFRPSFPMSKRHARRAKFAFAYISGELFICGSADQSKIGSQRRFICIQMARILPANEYTQQRFATMPYDLPSWRLLPECDSSLSYKLQICIQNVRSGAVLEGTRFQPAISETEHNRNVTSAGTDQSLRSTGQSVWQQFQGNCRKIRAPRIVSRVDR